VEYASKVVATKRLLELPPGVHSPLDPRSATPWPEQFQEVYDKVALEDLPRLHQELKDGREVFVDTRFSKAGDLKNLRKHFEGRVLAPGVIKLLGDGPKT
jgi:hypothetical protein